METIDWELQDQVIIVTGSGGGIGAGIVEFLVGLGAKVVINDKSPVKVRAMLKRVKEMGGEAIGISGDIGDKVTIEQIMKDTLRYFDRIDGLVNNVGIGADSDFPTLSYKKWLETFDVNINQPFQLTQKVTLQMQKQKKGGSILFISTTHTSFLGANTAYAASKAGIELLVKELALRLGKDKIRVNGLAPGAIQSHPRLNPADHNVPLGKKRGSVTDIAKAAAILLSPSLSGYTTGIIMRVDGGLSLTNTISKF
jgi:NAD(P)-dependent dehydrogenase (short-subunit alcohol dehydrogenase family)